MTSRESQPSAVPDAGFGLYIHWPFCAQKCPYCDFNSHVRHEGWDEAGFLSAYLTELDTVADWMREDAPQGPRTVSSIFIGGGTPSLMQSETVGVILDHAAKLWPMARDAEITLEANPGSVEASRFAGYKAAGVNRVSIGLQSLRDAQLKKLGRIHTVAEAKAALKIARRTFDRVSFDLIYARPGQSPGDWQDELAEALLLAEGHVSLYQLTIEPGTPYEALHKAGKLAVPGGEASLALYEITQEMTEAAGLPAYEISNHARPGDESRHNLLYWRYGTYAGIGPGAHGRLIRNGCRHATVAEKSPEAWVQHVEAQGHGMIERTALAPQEEADEMLLMGLRLREGLDLDALSGVAGSRPSDAAIKDLMGLGLLEPVDDRVSKESPANSGLATQTLAGLEEDFCRIRACLGPGGAPEPQAAPDRVRATSQGRLVLNRLVLMLSEAMCEGANTQFATQSR